MSGIGRPVYLISQPGTARCGAEGDGARAPITYHALLIPDLRAHTVPTMNFGWASAGKAALVAAALAALVLTGTEAWAKGGSGGRGGGGGRASHSGSKSGSHHHHHRGSRYSHSSSSGVFFYGSYFAFPAYWFASAPGLPREPV